MYRVFHFSLEDWEIGTVIIPKKSDFNNPQKERMESALEKIRLEFYNSFPSRLNCLFLAPTISSAQQWCRSININHWRQEKKEILFYVYEIEIEDKLLWFNADKLVEFYLPSCDEINASHGYWKSVTEDVEQNDLLNLYESMTSNSVKIVGKTCYKIDINGEIVEY